MRHASDIIRSAAPSYRTTFNDVQLIPPTYRSYRTGAPLPTYDLPAQQQQRLVLPRRRIESNFNIARNERELLRIAQRRANAQRAIPQFVLPRGETARETADNIEHLLQYFMVNRDREDQVRGSSASHPMTTRAAADSVIGARTKADLVPSPSYDEENMCPLELDNQTWDYGFMCNGSYRDLESYQRRAEELTNYAEKEAAIRRAHHRHCVQRSDSDASQTSMESMSSSQSD